MRNIIGSTVSAVLLAAAASAEAPGKSGAVQDTQAAPGTPVLEKADLKAAYKAIDSAYDIQWGANGILELEGKLDGLKGKVGEHVFDIAKIAYERCKGALTVARLYFLALCEQAEDHIQAKYIEEYKEEKPMGQLIPTWTQYKSSIGKGMEAGIDPMERNKEAGSLLYPTAAKYRAAVQAITGGTGSQAGNERNTAAETTNQLQLVVKGWSPAMSAAMQVLMPQLNRLTHEEQDLFQPKVLALAAEVKTFADKSHAEASNAESDFNKGVQTPDVDVGTRAALQAALDKDAKDKATAKPKRNVRAA